jgi:Predicted nucleoside-diphosphate sugar epimerases
LGIFVCKPCFTYRFFQKGLKNSGNKVGSTKRLIGRQGEPFLLLFIDFVSISLANTLYYYIRVRSGLFRIVTIPDFWGPTISLSLFFILLFWFWGLYRYSHLHSRFDEFVSISKASAAGVVVIFFAIFFDEATSGHAPHIRALILIYWSLVVILVGGARVVLRTVQRNLLIKGFGLHDTLIVGTGRRAIEVHNMILKYKALGIQACGIYWNFFNQTRSASRAFYGDNQST